MDAKTRETVVAWLQARCAGELDRLAELTAADAGWESPVAGEVHGRDALVRQVAAGFADTDSFASSVLALECRDDRAVAVVHNTGRRDGEQLDSLQTLFLRVEDGLVADVRVAVDDEDAVEAFWDDSPADEV